MNKIISKLNKISLTSNSLKIIAILTMIIDHIGYYFEPNINNIVYIMLRAIGRISMPLFAYLIVQGFFYTKDLKKYILRIFIFALITQLAIFGVSVFDENRLNMSVNTQLNILFSYTLSLILLWVIHEKNIIKKYDSSKNMFVKILMILTIIGIYVFIPFDYEVYLPLFIVMLYFIEKLKITIYMQRQNYNISIKGIVASSVSEDKIKKGYILLILLAMITIITRSYNPMYWYMLLAIIPIYLYNGERGKNNNKVKYLFYTIFPLQHFLIYLVSILIQK